MLVLHFSIAYVCTGVDNLQEFGSPTGWVSGTKLKHQDLAAGTFIHSTVSLPSLL